MASRSIRRERAAKGLCPTCGEMAAPYYLCDRCHMKQQLGKWCRSRPDVFSMSRSPNDRRKSLIGLTPFGRSEQHTGCELKPRELDLGQRGKPRLRGVPVDVQEELLRMLSMRPMTEPEIIDVWVKLRPRKGAGTVAQNMARLIAAQDRRARRLARNASQATGAPA